MFTYIITVEWTIYKPKLFNRTITAEIKLQMLLLCYTSHYALIRGVLYLPDISSYSARRPISAFCGELQIKYLQICFII